MSEIFRDDQGRIMARDPAGGVGGGATSMATRPATPEEISGFHDQNVKIAQAALDQAKAEQKDHHGQDVVVGASPPPGPLDPSSLVAQGAVGSPGNPDPRLGVPLGGHTEQQGQPQQAVDAGERAPAVPERTRPPEAPPPTPVPSPVSSQMANPRGAPGTPNPGSATTPTSS